jgi:aryl-alcohol dehydrogenase-like predicted oxidoreductase
VKSAALLGAASLANAAGGSIPKRQLGKTGLQVSVFGLGGAPLGNLPDLRPAVDIVRRCYDLGVTYFDCASSGAYGLSQIRYGTALQGVRENVVLATKTRNRTRDQAEIDLNQSLQFLKTDRIDVYQIHNLTSDDDAEAIFAPKGVMELVEKARKAGKIRFVGITCHTDPAILARVLDRYPFDTVLMPLSTADGAGAQKSFERTVLPIAVRKRMGVIAMKVYGAGKILKEKALKEKECLEYVLSLPASTAILGCSEPAQAERNAAIAASAKPLSAAAMDSLRNRISAHDLAMLQPWKGLEADVVYKAD